MNAVLNYLALNYRSAVANFAHRCGECPESRTGWRSGMNSDWQFRFSNNLMTDGCLVRQHSDEPLLVGLRKGVPVARRAVPKPSLRAVVWKFQNRYRQFEFIPLRRAVRSNRGSHRGRITVEWKAGFVGRFGPREFRRRAFTSNGATTIGTAAHTATPYT